MTELSTIANAIGTNGFVDFYELLGLPGTAPTELVQERINDLYSKAQANREHRHQSKRREAELLLELLPQALVALSNPDNRARYDAYTVASRVDAAPMEFSAFMNTLVAGQNGERIGGLAARATPAPISTPHADSLSPTAKSRARAIPTHTNTQPAAHSAAHASPRRARRPGMALPLIVALITFVLCDSAFHAAPWLSIGLSVGMAGKVWYFQGLHWRARRAQKPRVGEEPVAAL